MKVKIGMENALFGTFHGEADLMWFDETHRHYVARRPDGFEFCVPEVYVSPSDRELFDFTRAFLGCLLEINSGDDREIPDDKGIFDFAPPTREKLAGVCREFWTANREVLLQKTDYKGNSVAENAGSDFALSVTGTGCGFDDGDWPGGDQLGVLCRDEKYWWIEFNGPYMGDDGLIYFMGAETEPEAPMPEHPSDRA